MRAGIWQLLPKKNRWSTVSDLFRQLSSATGTTVSRQTVYRRLGHIGPYARRPVEMCSTPRNSLSPSRLTWSREHALWTPQQWSWHVFRRVPWFSLQSDSRRTLIIWRAPGTRYHRENNSLKSTTLGWCRMARLGGIVLFQN
ncbi:transposable element Tcb1 transposase [Trichonephila clavipes]|nr:transposable element Tcb1 transposase [Trichonephila clavipes]